MRTAEVRTILAAVALLVAAVPGFAALLPSSADMSKPPTTDAGRPFLISTDPANATMSVPLYAWVIIDFSSSMNASNWVVRVDPPVTWRPFWLNWNTTLLLMHNADFVPCTTYWVFVDAVDAAGGSLLVFNDAPMAPDPWFFTTACSVFTITRTDPADNETNFPAGPGPPGGYGRDIVISFSRAADPSSFDWTIFPWYVVPFVPVWSNGNATVTLNHDWWFTDCTWHTITVTAKDRGGNPLNTTAGKPSRWQFETVCLYPEVAQTDPPDGAVDVPIEAPIVVTFSEPMDPATVNWSVTSAIPQPNLTFAPSWTVGNSVLTLTHAALFLQTTTYQVYITGRNAYGDSLVFGPVPNPWSFTTSARVSAPAGLRVALEPPDVVLTWDAVPGAPAYTVYGSADRFAPWPWPRVAVGLSGTRFVDGGADADRRTHHYVVRAQDSGGLEGGNSTMGVKFPLDFAYGPDHPNIYWVSLPYRSPYRTAKDISDALGPRDANVDVIGKWDPAKQSTSVWAFFRGAWRGTNFAINAGDGVYVSAHANFTWILNGTDRAVSHTFAGYAPPNANVHWISLPASSAYARASDLVRDIEGGAMGSTWIAEVATWDAASQSLVRFRWMPSGWTGVDFLIPPGTGISFVVRASFAWTPALITREVP